MWGPFVGTITRFYYDRIAAENLIAVTQADGFDDHIAMPPTMTPEEILRHRAVGAPSWNGGSVGVHQTVYETAGTRCDVSARIGKHGCHDPWRSELVGENLVDGKKNNRYKGRSPGIDFTRDVESV